MGQAPATALKETALLLEASLSIAPRVSQRYMSEGRHYRRTLCDDPQ